LSVEEIVENSNKEFVGSALAEECCEEGEDPDPFVFPGDFEGSAEN